MPTIILCRTGDNQQIKYRENRIQGGLDNFLEEKIDIPEIEKTKEPEKD